MSNPAPGKKEPWLRRLTSWVLWPVKKVAQAIGSVFAAIWESYGSFEGAVLTTEYRVIGIVTAIFGLGLLLGGHAFGTGLMLAAMTILSLEIVIRGLWSVGASDSHPGIGQMLNGLMARNYGVFDAIFAVSVLFVGLGGTISGAFGLVLIGLCFSVYCRVLYILHVRDQNQATQTAQPAPVPAP